jgi:hypothetical protein
MLVGQKPSSDWLAGTEERLYGLSDTEEIMFLAAMASKAKE